MKRISAMKSAMVMLVLYPLSYLVASRDGFYEPWAFGLMQGKSGERIQAPKGSGYYWIPFEGYTEAGGLDGISALGWLYMPMVSLDRALWHRNELWQSGRYRTKGFFDYETMEYRDIE